MPVLKWTLVASRDNVERDPPRSGYRPRVTTSHRAIASVTERVVVDETADGANRRDQISLDPDLITPARLDGPTGPPLRANPSPEVTDRLCRLPLSTLDYRPEAMHLGDRMRISVRPPTRSLSLHNSCPSAKVFKGRR